MAGIAVSDLPAPPVPPVPPLFHGVRPAARRVLLRDPLGVSRIDRPGILFAVEYVAGAPWRMHVMLNATCIAHVPPEWVIEQVTPANVVPLVPLAVPAWAAELHRLFAKRPASPA